MTWSERYGAQLAGTAARLGELMDDRRQLALLPTPLHHAPRLSAALGAEIWLKRDDLTGLGMGGNKARKLELLTADAVRCGADTLVSVGAAQSNHARTVAAAAATAGLECELIVGGHRPGKLRGNLLLNEILGASLHFAGTEDWAELDTLTGQVAAAARERGASPYVIPVGGSVPLGVAAFAAAYVELRQQCELAGLRPAAIVHASSSGGTQAGLELGRCLAGGDLAVVGVDVAKITGSLADEVRRLIDGTAELLGIAAPAASPRVIDGYLGPGYAVASEGGERALELLARTEGVIADPVYTAKALHALSDEAFEGPVVFWHTGGTPALFAEGAPA
ncbi:MAG TPA: pyridoxal-phosphate dependent enzyme [Streptosporangiaceae bacterium]|nr:pyridoxal-phosphate dependent enzyme [Streptosporangiaceae bacterium]